MSNTVTSAFIDLATFDEIEKYLYNGPTAITFFVRCVRKSTWFAQVPVPLTQNAGNPQFNGDVAFQISRAGDYLLHTWLRFTLPAVTVSGAGTARWCRNIGHNLIDLCWISFNDLKVQEFDSYWLDMWSQFTMPASKQNGYNNMIGNVAELTTAAASLPAYTVNVPLPFFFTRDTGVALPTAALPYNEMRIHFEFRDHRDLLIVDGTLTSATPQIKNVQLWANYAVVSNEERVKMGKCPRDMVIEQVQRHGGRSFNAEQIGSTSNSPFDIRFSHSIKALFWNVANTTQVGSDLAAREWSNYTTGHYGLVGQGADTDVLAADPIGNTSLLYENTFRLFEMGSDFFSLVQPWYHFTSIPEETGYHVYSFALNPEAMDPSASTNFGKLTNVSLQLTPSEAAVVANGATDLDASPVHVKQTFQVFIRALNFNIVRISGGETAPRKVSCQQNIGSFAGSTLDHQFLRIETTDASLITCY